MPPKISYSYVWVDGRIRVDAAVECGQSFEGIAWILDPNSRTPLLHLEKPTGAGTVQIILDRVKEGFAVPTIR